ncbi:MAG: hypothetical protein LBG09_02565 [Puniceicoccales bacterium]|nr:hypothetical protein [Puniceicoccales bacterium]
MESLKCSICGKPAAVHIEQITHSCSAGASYITGAVVTVDGGMAMG